MNSLPDGWATAPLASLGFWCGGGTPSKRRPDYWKNGTIPWVSPKDMKVAVIRDAEDHITEEAVHGSATNLVDGAAVLVVTRSGILRHTLPIAVTARAVALNQDIKALMPFPGLEPRFIAWALRWQATNILRECSKEGTTVQSIETQRLLRFRIPIAPAQEQGRIVEAIEEQISRIDAGAASLRQVRTKLNYVRAAVLRAAVSGKLVAQDPADQPASMVVDAIRNRRLAQSKDTGSAILLEDLPVLPPSWIWTTIGALFDVYVGATPARSRPEFWSGDIPWVSSGEVAFNRIHRTRETISLAALANGVRRIHPPGTVLLAMIGEGKTRGQAAILDVAAAHNQNCASIHVSETEILPEYIYWVLVERYERTRLLASGGNQPALNGDRVRSIPIPLPPIPEQQRIVDEIARHDTFFGSLQSTVDNLESRATRLRSSVLNEAFRGRLVPQDMKDEPASALLERITPERVLPVEPRLLPGGRTKSERVSA